jgi:hypothetical protein
MTETEKARDREFRDRLDAALRSDSDACARFGVDPEPEHRPRLVELPGGNLVNPDQVAAIEYIPPYCGFLEGIPEIHRLSVSLIGGRKLIIDCESLEGTLGRSGAGSGLSSTGKTWRRPRSNRPEAPMPTRLDVETILYHRAGPQLDLVWAAGRASDQPYLPTGHTALYDDPIGFGLALSGLRAANPVAPTDADVGRVPPARFYIPFLDLATLRLLQSTVAGFWRSTRRSRTGASRGPRPGRGGATS